MNVLRPLGSRPLCQRVHQCITYSGFRSCGLRLLCRSSSSSTSKTLHESRLNVPSFGGKLVCNTKFDVNVTAAGSHEYPNLDRAFVRVFGQEQDANRINVKVEQKGMELKVDSEPKDGEIIEHNIKQEIQIPMVHNISLIASDNASAEVSEMMESDYCLITGSKGDVSVSAIKTGTLHVVTKTGDILCHGHNQGDIVLKTDGGNVVADRRFSGPSLDISTNSGDIRVASCYSDQSKFSTNTGSMNLRNLHHESYIAVYEKGDVYVQGLDGCTNIFVKKGEVNCNMSRILAESRIHVEDGDVHLRVNEAHPIKICIEANDIIPDAKLRNMGQMEVLAKEGLAKHFSCAIHPDKFSPTVLVIAENGRVILDCQDWAASLGLKMPPVPNTTKN